MTAITSLYNAQQAVEHCKKGKCAGCHLANSNDCMNDLLKLLKNVEAGLNGDIQIRPRNKAKKKVE